MRCRPALVTTMCLLAGAMVAEPACEPRVDRAGLSTQLSLQDTLGTQSDDARFEHALAPRTFTFPRDHGPHPGFRNEWWYWTGNLRGPLGRRFGYQLTIFRTALGREQAQRESAWAAEQAYMAHFTVSEIAPEREPGFHAFERLSRAAVGLAGAAGEPFGVWVLDWSASELPAGDAGVHTPFALRLRARDSGVGIELQLEQGKRPVLQGNAGLSQKGSQPGNASFYYSLTRMPTTGVLTVGGDDMVVEGASWMDREWSTSALEAGQTGWDWFALQLDDGRDLMFFRLRRADGSVDEHSHGSIVDAVGNAIPLSASDVRVDVTGRWTSPVSGTTYPARFRLQVQNAATPLDVTITPARANQELDVSFRYWEGAVLVRGESGTTQGMPAKTIEGRGYVELTGYDEHTAAGR